MGREEDLQQVDDLFNAAPERAAALDDMSSGIALMKRLSFKRK